MGMVVLKLLCLTLLTLVAGCDGIVASPTVAPAPRTICGRLDDRTCVGYVAAVQVTLPAAAVPTVFVGDCDNPLPEPCDRIRGGWIVVAFASGGSLAFRVTGDPSGPPLVVPQVSAPPFIAVPSPGST
jgi:hypothetical protein